MEGTCRRRISYSDGGYPISRHFVPIFISYTCESDEDEGGPDGVDSQHPRLGATHRHSRAGGQWYSWPLAGRGVRPRRHRRRGAHRHV
eukprot:scaffold19436_cov152-Isochrysis_galbana.AAC.6